MLERKSGALILSALLLTACGGGGGGGGSTPSVVIPTPTAIAGTVTPPVAPFPGPLSLNADVRTPPNSGGTWPAIVQSMGYTFDSAAAAATPSTLKVSSLNINPVETQIGQTSVFSGAAYPTEPALGQLMTMQSSVPSHIFTLSTTGGGVVSQSTLFAGLPTITITDPGAFSLTTIWPDPTGIAVVAGYVLPYSPTLNPAGYSYQTFGSWLSYNKNTGGYNEYYISFGAPTVAATLPVVGTANYTGVAAGSLVDAATRDPADTTATMNATVNFAARTVAFATTGTTSLSNNAAAGTLPTANSGLNMSGTLSYAAGSNTFTGAVTTTNGMSGNATGRFYGPGIAAATATKAVGAPPEIGGTFAVMATGVGAMQGAFGGN